MQNQSLSISTFLAASIINDGTPLVYASNADKIM